MHSVTFCKTHILPYLIHDPEYREKWLKHFNPDHCNFITGNVDRTVMRILKRLGDFEGKPISKAVLLNEVEDKSLKLSEEEHKQAKAYLQALPETLAEVSREWLNDRTLEFYREKESHRLISQSIEEKSSEKGQALLYAAAEAMNFNPEKEEEFQVLTLDQAIDSFDEPEYLIFQLFKKSYLYAMTGATASGKTALAARLAWHVATGKPLGDREVSKGLIIYFAGENPDDTIPRLIATFGDDDRGNFLIFKHDTKEAAEKAIAQLVKMSREIAFVIFDTNASYFDGDDDNNNIQALAHANWYRSVCRRLPGKPTVLVCCHPAKGAEKEGLINRGGSSFNNNIDGNLSCEKAGDLSIIKQCGKYREVPFDPIAFKREAIIPKGLKNFTVIAHHITPDEATKAQNELAKDELELLTFLSTNRYTSLSKIAEKLMWFNGKGEALKPRVKRALDSLKDKKLVSKETTPTLTEAGLEAVSGGVSPHQEPYQKTVSL